jgi:hypothetical protein
MLLKNMMNVLAGVAIAVLLSGCSAGDIGFNGKVFDAMGMNTASVKKTPKMAERAGIIVPPNLERLPEPGSGGGQPAVADVQDHDSKRVTAYNDLERQQEAYCKVHFHDAKIHGDQDAVLATGPLGPCQGSVLRLMKEPSDASAEQ